MSDSIWPWWIVAKEPDGGVYQVQMIAGLETSNPNVGPHEKVLYVCKSLNGYLNNAFSWDAVSKREIVQAYREEAIAAGYVPNAKDGAEDEEESGS